MLGPLDECFEWCSIFWNVKRKPRKEGESGRQMPN
jgi:hypothetical protein